MTISGDAEAHRAKIVFGIITVCLLTMAVRLAFCAGLQHKVIQFGDAYFYLSGASNILAFIQENWKSYGPALFAHLPAATSGEYNIMRSVAVSDRLINDGPVYSSFLAVVLFIAGLTPGSLAFDGIIQALQTAASLVDAVTAALIYAVAYMVAPRGQKHNCGLVAALVWAFYPSSIINTQYCYAEPFDSLVLTFYTCLVILSMRAVESGKHGWKTLLALFFCGITTAIVALTKPLFLFIPPLASIFLLSSQLSRLRILISKALVVPALTWFAGLTIVLLPWFCATAGMTGKPLLYVNRSPAFNLYLGNQLDRDGWRAYPFQTGITSDVSYVISEIKTQCSDKPLAFAGLQARKLARLWLGPWNEFERKLFGFDIETQEFLHHWLLVLSVCGAVVLLAAGVESSFASVSAAIIITHMGFVLVEPISRYNFTAMPTVILLAVLGLFYLSEVRQARLVIVSSGLFALTAAAYPAFLALVGAAGFNGAFYALLLYLSSLVCIYVGHVILQKTRRGPVLYVQSSCCAVFCLVAACAISGSPVKPELSSPAVEYDQFCPVSPIAGTFGTWLSQVPALLIDMQGTSPDLTVAVNGKKAATTAYPWWQLAGDKDFIDVLDLQTAAMAVSNQSQRQWWVVALPPNLLREGALNRVKISGLDDFKIFSPRYYNDMMPSLGLSSWTKGYCTTEHLDCRVYQKRPDSLKTRRDKSGRVLLAFLPRSPVAGNLMPAHRDILVTPQKTISLRGDNPLAMKLATLPLKVKAERGAHFRVDAELNGATDSAFINVVFSGRDTDGKMVHWVSPWQPTRHLVRSTPRSFTFGDFIPDEVASLDNLTASITVFPFHLDLLYLSRKEAARRQLEISRLELTTEETGLVRLSREQIEKLQIY